MEAQRRVATSRTTTRGHMDTRTKVIHIHTRYRGADRPRSHRYSYRSVRVGGQYRPIPALVCSARAQVTTLSGLVRSKLMFMRRLRVLL